MICRISWLGMDLAGNRSSGSLVFSNNMKAMQLFRAFCSSTSAPQSLELDALAFIKDIFELAMLLSKYNITFDSRILNLYLSYYRIVWKISINKFATSDFKVITVIFMLFSIRWHCFQSLPVMNESENLRTKIEMLPSNESFSIFTVN